MNPQISQYPQFDSPMVPDLGDIPNQMTIFDCIEEEDVD